ncbi:hypothetical protein [Klebsiella michiganensis]|uniref:hypothetical protein n=1 Tax=Klebsiella michiganensis TaxID=1134687 RepID=UPI00206CBB49|nr:hypothetical protein [Klebsiella michiganensis]MDM4569654.1 hypothetical protein [Klebsiella michiganensis]MDM4585468.1 hypothetical protein [Klebsiella michiganensis]DAN16256.1 MAG TPA: hypothetical protein [Caudoviricetes sp.]
MTTDITELAQRLKLEVHRAVSNFNPQMNIKTRDLKELVGALEKAQAGEKQWREVVDAFCTDDADWHNLTNSNNELIALLSQALCKQADRIAELESRTVNVKLPTTIEPSAFAPWVAKAFYQFHRDTVNSCFAVFSDACATAGIKVEAE